ncbi:MAG: hypothetical protein NTV48_01320 [Candidatus Vogelbacteria bacterium]|nr:hypothetical protein [Candidatus Vogelbacteria bacterium]
MVSLVYLRSFRIFNFAIFDIAISLLGMYLLSGILSKIFLKIGVEIPQRSWVLWALPIGIAVHLAVGQMTPMTKNLIDLNGHYVLKIIILAFFVAGFVGVKLVK